MNFRRLILVVLVATLLFAGIFQGINPISADFSGVSSALGTQTIDTSKGRLVEYDFERENNDFLVPNRAGAEYQGRIRGNVKEVPGKNGSAVRFSGLSGSIRVQNSSSLALRRTVTIAFWIRPSIEQESNLLGNYGSFHFWLYGDQVVFTVMNNGTRLAEPSSEIPIGEWTHVVGVYHQERGARLFINGDLAAEEETQNIPLDPLSGDLRLNMGGWNDGFRGEIDSFGVWSRSISDIEAKTLYKEREEVVLISSYLRFAIALSLILLVFILGLFGK